MHQFLTDITAKVISDNVVRVTYHDDSADIPFDFTEGTFGIEANNLDALLKRNGIVLSVAEHDELFDYLQASCSV